MARFLGTTMIWVSWLYIAIAVITAKITYHKAHQNNPTYFSSPTEVHPDPFKFGEARGVFDLIRDNALENKGFSASIIKRVRLIQFMYLTAPIALILFFVGLIIR